MLNFKSNNQKKFYRLSYKTDDMKIIQKTALSKKKYRVENHHGTFLLTLILLWGRKKMKIQIYKISVKEILEVETDWLVGFHKRTFLYIFSTLQVAMARANNKAEQIIPGVRPWTPYCHALGEPACKVHPTSHCRDGGMMMKKKKEMMMYVSNPTRHASRLPPWSSKPLNCRTWEEDLFKGFHRQLAFIAMSCTSH